MQGSKRGNFCEGQHNIVGDDSRVHKLLSTVDDPVPHRRNHDPVRNRFQGLGDRISMGGVALASANALHLPRGMNDLRIGVDDLIFQRRRAGIQDKDVHD